MSNGLVWRLDELNHRLGLDWRWLCDWNERRIWGPGELPDDVRKGFFR